MAFNQKLLDIMQEWQLVHEQDVIDIDAAAKWAVETKRYQKPPMTMEQQCRIDMRRALQQSHYIDNQGNKVRAKHAVKIEYNGEQLTLYVDSRTAKPDLMQKTFDQIWKAIANDVKRHSIETQSYDLNNPYGETLSLFDYNFNGQAEEARMTGEYEEPDDDDDGEDGDAMTASA